MPLLVAVPDAYHIMLLAGVENDIDNCDRFIERSSSAGIGTGGVERRGGKLRNVTVVVKKKKIVRFRGPPTSCATPSSFLGVPSQLDAPSLGAPSFLGVSQLDVPSLVGVSSYDAMWEGGLIWRCPTACATLVF